MKTPLDALPSDPDALRAIIAAQAADLARKDVELRSRDTLIEKLKAQLAALKRARFGARSEKIERAIAQLELALEDIEAGEAVDLAAHARKTEAPSKAKPARQLLPDHLPREEVRHEARGPCPDCGGANSARWARTSPRCWTMSPPRSV